MDFFITIDFWYSLTLLFLFIFYMRHVTRIILLFISNLNIYCMQVSKILLFKILCRRNLFYLCKQCCWPYSRKSLSWSNDVFLWQPGSASLLATFTVRDFFQVEDCSFYGEAEKLKIERMGKNVLSSQISEVQNT